MGTMASLSGRRIRRSATPEVLGFKRTKDSSLAHYRMPLLTARAFENAAQQVVVRDREIAAVAVAV